MLPCPDLLLTQCSFRAPSVGMVCDVRAPEIELKGVYSVAVHAIGISSSTVCHIRAILQEWATRRNIVY